MIGELIDTDNLERFIAQTKALINGMGHLVERFNNSVLVNDVNTIRDQMLIIEQEVYAILNYVNTKDKAGMNLNSDFKEVFAEVIPRCAKLLSMLMINVEQINQDDLADVIWLATNRLNDVKNEYGRLIG